jgi:cytosine/adenosine deaminase-related metal-dependent hydrolase
MRRVGVQQTPVFSTEAIKLCEAHCVAGSAYHIGVSGFSRVRRSGGLVDRASAGTVHCPASALRLAPTTHPALPCVASGGTAEGSPDRCRSPEH